jgi:hypothetical protein
MHFRINESSAAAGAPAENCDQKVAQSNSLNQRADSHPAGWAGKCLRAQVYLDNGGTREAISSPRRHIPANCLEVRLILCAKR